MAHKKYADKPLYDEVKKRFSIGGTSYRNVLDVRNEFMNLMGKFSGRWPHTLAIQPGGATIHFNSAIRINYGLDSYMAFKEKAEATILGGPVEDWLGLNSLSDLQGFIDGNDSDVALFVKAGLEFGLNEIGKGPDVLLTPASYQQPDGSYLFKGGVFEDGKVTEFDQAQITEAVRHSYFTEGSGGHPMDGSTVPDYDDDPDRYTWIKAPRYQGRPFEVGPLARMIVDGDPLVTDLFNRLGSNVFTRVAARLQEGVKTLAALGGWMEAIDVTQPNITNWESPQEGEGIGFGPAGRGLLGHWVKVEDGVIKNYQVITPTAVNGSPRDDNDVPGPMESASLGTAIKDPQDPVEILHIVRSFDPCLVCSCHAVDTTSGKE